MIQRSMRFINAREHDPRWSIVLDLLNCSKHLWIAGGSVLKYVIKEELGSSDFDVFFKYKIDRLILQHILKEKGFGLSKNTFNAITYTKDDIIIQLVKQEYSCMMDCIEDFDLSICKFATDGNTVYTFKHSLEHAANRIFDLDRINNPPSTEGRILKYWLAGFEPIGRAKDRFDSILVSVCKNEFELKQAIATASIYRQPTRDMEF